MARMTPDEQRAAALKLGNAVRTRHANFRRAFNALPFEQGKCEAVSILRDDFEAYEDMKARYLIESIHRFGPTRMGRLIRKIGLAQGRLDTPLGELTERERHLIADHLENPDLPAAVSSGSFNTDELELIRLVCTQVAHKTRFGKQRNQLWTIAQKAGAVL